MATKTAQLFVNLLGKSSSFAKAMDDACSKLSKTEQKFKSFGKALVKAVTLPTGVVGGLAVRAFAKFDKAMAEALSVFDNVDTQMRKKMESTALAMSEKYNRAAHETAKGLWYLGSAGLSAAASIEALPIVTRFAAAAQTDLDYATQLLIQSQTSLGMAYEDPIKNAQELTRVSDVLAKANIMSIGSIEQFAEALSNKAGGAARVLNMDIEKTVAVLAAFSQMGITGEQAGEAFNIVLRDLTNTAIKHNAVWKKAGIDVFDPATGKLRDMGSVIDDLTRKLEPLNDEGRQKFLMMLKNPQRSIAYTKMLLGMGQAIRDFEAGLREAGGTTEKIAEKQLKNVIDQAGLVVQALKNLGIEILARYRPQMQVVIDKAKEAVAGLRDLSVETQDQIVKWSLVAAAIGPVLVGVASLIKVVLFVKNALLSLVLGIVAVSKGFAGLVVWAAKGVAAFTMLHPIIAALIAAVVGLATAYLKFGGTWSGLWEIVKGAAYQAVYYIITVPFRMLSAALGPLLDAFFAFRDELLGVWRSIREGVVDEAARIWNTLATMVKHPTATWGEAQQILQKQQAAAAETARILSSQQAAAKKALEGAGGVDGLTKKYETYKGALVNAALGLVGIKAKTEAATATHKEATGAVDEVRQAFEKMFPELANNANGAGKLAKEADKAKEALQGLRDELREAQADARIDALQEGMSKALEVGDAAGYQGYVEQLKQATYDAVIWGHRKAIEEAGKTYGAEAKKVAEEHAQFAADQFAEKQQQAWSEKIAEDAKREGEQVAEFWATTFENQLNGETIFDGFKSALKQIAVGFAAQLATAITMSIPVLRSFLAGISSPQQLGAVLANSMFGLPAGSGLAQGAMGAAGGGLFSSLLGGGAIGGAMTAADTAAISSAAAGATTSEAATAALFSGGGSSWALSMENAIPYAAIAYNAYSAFRQIGKGAAGNFQAGLTLGLTGIGAAIGGPLGAAIGGTIGNVGGGYLAKALGLDGPSHPETLARIAVKDFMDKALKEAQVYVEREGGIFERLMGIDIGDNKRFNDPGWGDQFNSLADNTRTAFLGVSEALMEVLGISEDIAGQFAMIFAENLGGSIDNLRRMVQDLGWSFDDMKAKLFEAAMEGKMTWQEYAVYVQGLTEAFKPGLEKLGAYSEAFGQIRDRGRGALNDIKTAAVEAQEAQIKTFDEWKAKLLEDYDPEQVNAFFQALEQRGIKSFDELMNASDEQIAGVVADMSTLGFAFQEVASDVEGASTKVDELNTKLDELDGREVSVHVNIIEHTKSEDEEEGGGEEDEEEGDEKGARGAIITGPGIFAHTAQLGEAGKEGVLPLARVGGKLGVLAAAAHAGGGGGVNLVINAPQAAPGVEHAIRREVMRMEPVIIAKALQAVDNDRRRGR